jgi:glycyl-tRNA synthetase beta subunit
MKKYELFDGKTMEDVFRDIYDNHEAQKKDISGILKTMAKHIIQIEDAVALGPVIQTLLDTGIKNDEQLIKMANVAQRIIAIENKVVNTSDNLGLTEEEKEKLLKQAREELEQDNQDIQDELERVKNKIK